MYVPGRFASFGSSIPECARPCVPAYCTPSELCAGRSEGDEVAVPRGDGTEDVYRCVAISTDMVERCDAQAAECVRSSCPPGTDITIREGDLAAVYAGRRPAAGRPKPGGEKKKADWRTAAVVGAAVVLAALLAILLFRRRGGFALGPGRGQYRLEGPVTFG